MRDAGTHDFDGLGKIKFENKIKNDGLIETKINLHKLAELHDGLSWYMGLKATKGVFNAHLMGIDYKDKDVINSTLMSCEKDMTVQQRT